MELTVSAYLCLTKPRIRTRFVPAPGYPTPSEKNMIRIIRNSSTLFLLFMVTAFAFAQTSNGTLTGTVTDQSGAAISGATVTIKSVETDAVRTAVTISNGSYRIESILPGTYSVSVSAASFAETVVQGLSIPASVVTNSDVSPEGGQQERCRRGQGR